MKEITQSALQSLYNSHPQAYFLIETVMHQASSKDWEAITEKVDVIDEARLSRAIRWHVERADERWLSGQQEGDKQSISRYAPNHRFRFYGYKQVQAELAPTTFLCRKCGYVVSLKKKIAENKLTRSDLICPQCKISLKQVVHVFGHPHCGEIVEIAPQRCPECKESAFLNIDNISFGRSAWLCQNGHKRALSMNCPACVSLGEEKAHMTPYAAGAAVKPAAVTMVDIRTDVDWEEVVRKRLAVKQESLRESILEQYKSDPIAWAAVKQRLDSNEAVRRQMYEQFLEVHPELRNRQDAIKQAIGGEPKFIIQRSLTEYHGTEQAAIKSPEDPLNQSLRKLILQKFHLFPRYIADLPILQIVYGYQVGTSNLEEARVRTFDRGWDSAALTNRMRTEAALFDLDPTAVASWISAIVGASLDELTLHKMLIQPEISDKEKGVGQQEEVYQLVETLLHTLAHLMIRQSEIFTGLSRESLSEMIFPPALAFALICEDGSELGALRSAFASYRLLDWFGQALFASRECALDPVCIEGKITGSAACHSCLFISERRCNGYWNERLDRRLVSEMRRNNGFWDR
jgi:hypothetical protein